MSGIWTDQKLLFILEEKRDVLRCGGKRLTYDCLETLVANDRVTCRKGHQLSHANDGGMALITVLRGVSSGSCIGCSDYVEEKQ